MFPNFAGRHFTVEILYLEGIRRTISYTPGEGISDQLDPPGLIKNWGKIKKHFIKTRKETTPSSYY